MLCCGGRGKREGINPLTWSSVLCSTGKAGLFQPIHLHAFSTHPSSCFLNPSTLMLSQSIDPHTFSIHQPSCLLNPSTLMPSQSINPLTFSIHPLPSTHIIFCFISAVVSCVLYELISVTGSMPHLWQGCMPSPSRKEYSKNQGWGREWFVALCRGRGRVHNKVEGGCGLVNSHSQLPHTSHTHTRTHTHKHTRTHAHTQHTHSTPRGSSLQQYMKSS